MHMHSPLPDVPHSLVLAETGIQRAITIIGMLVSIIKHSLMYLCLQRYINKATQTHTQNTTCQLSPHENIQSSQQKINWERGGKKDRGEGGH